MGLAFAVRQDDGFVVVNKADARTDKMVFHELVLQTGGNREAEVHFLEILFCDVQGFRVVDCVCPESVIDGVDGFLEILSFFKTDERNRGLDEYG